jgi:hypothetical protein
VLCCRTGCAPSVSLLPFVTAVEARDFLLKAGPKTQKLPVEPEQAVTKSNRAYAVSSDINERPGGVVTPSFFARSLRMATDLDFEILNFLSASDQ